MEKKEALVSIITPTYNHERYIANCIESVLAQKYPNWEQIIIDDASTDGTPGIVEQYSSKDRRIELLRHNTNYGVQKLSDTYNEALYASRGEFVAILEGDDLWPTHKLQKQLELFSDQKVVVTWGSGKIIDEEGKGLGVVPQAWKKWPEDIMCNRPVGTALKALLRHFFLMPAVTLIFRRKALVEIGGFWQPKEYFAVDYPTCLKISLQGEFRYSKEILGCWRNHPKQVTSTSAHTSTTVVGDEFLSGLPERKRRELGLEEMEKSLAAWSSWIKGRRLMASGQRKKAREHFAKALFHKAGVISLKAGTAFLLSYLIPSLLQYKLKTPLKSNTLLKRIVRHRSSE